MRDQKTKSLATDRERERERVSGGYLCAGCGNLAFFSPSAPPGFDRASGEMPAQFSCSQPPEGFAAFSRSFLALYWLHAAVLGTLPSDLG